MSEKNRKVVRCCFCGVWSDKARCGYVESTDTGMAMCENCVLDSLAFIAKENRISISHGVNEDNEKDEAQLR